VSSGKINYLAPLSIYFFFASEQATERERERRKRYIYIHFNIRRQSIHTCVNKEKNIAYTNGIGRPVARTAASVESEKNEHF
jgi:hypothetical protein